MPWIAKNSAGTQIETRTEPYLTQGIKDKVTTTFLPRYEKSQGALIPTLHEIQHTYGWIPHQAMVEVAEFLDLSPGEVMDTASFYEEFWLNRKGEHVIAVCRSIACEICDHSKVTECAKKKLGIGIGETTDDGKFTLIELECLGSCGTAPVALLDETLHEQLTPERMDQIIEAVQQGRSPENQGAEGSTPSV
jgi:NADH-quinone oxidoreductase subunit E